MATGNIVPSGNGGSSNPIVFTHKVYKSDFNFDSTYNYYRANVQCSSEELGYIEDAVLTLITTELYRPDVEWFAHAIVANDSLPPNIVKNNTDKQVISYFCLNDSSLAQNIVGVNVQYNPVQPITNRIIVAVMIKADLYNLMTANDYFEHRFVCI